MDQDKNKSSIPNTKKNFESFDIWSQAQFAMWSNVRYDFELIAELTRYRKSARSCLEILDTVNKHLKNPPEKIFFDGTIKCLKFLIKNNYLNLSNLPTITNDEKYLVELLKKYSKRLDITDILSDIEVPTIRAMLLEYPNLIGELLNTDDPLAGQIISKALLKNGITDIESLTKKVDSGINSIEVDLDKNSKEAMRCKIIYLGLFINNGKFHVSGNAVGIIGEFEKLTDEVVENQTYTKSVFNSIYVALYAQSEWNKEKKIHLTGCETLQLNFQLLFLPDNHMSKIYDIFLKEEVDKIGKKYFGEEYRPEGFMASMAIKMAVVIILFRAENFIPKDEKPSVSLFSAGAMLGGLNYAVEETDDEQKPLRLKKWFLDYFRSELDKRVAFIKLQSENFVGVYKLRNIVRVVYIPVFESFRFFCASRGLLEQTIELLKNEKILSNLKDDILINFVINIQKVNAEKQSSNDEKYYKDTFTLLISETFMGLIVNLSKKLKHQAKKYYEFTDLESDALLAVIELILNFDMNKNDSFIAYLIHNLPLKMRTFSRKKKTDDLTDTENILENDFDEDELKDSFMHSIPDTKNFMESLESQKNLEKIRECMDKLPEKEKEAVKKLAESNEKFNDTERKAKNRGLNRIREMMGIS